MRFPRVIMLLLAAMLLTVGTASAQTGVRISSPVTANGGAFLHIARSIGPDANINGPITRIVSEYPRANISPLTDGTSNTIMFATHNMAFSTGTHQKPTSLMEEDGIWYLYNDDGTTAMNQGAAFNIQVQGLSDSVFIHTAKAGNITSYSHVTTINHPLLNGNPDAIISVTPRFKGIANNHYIGVWYEPTSARWTIFNQDLAAMPVGAKFNVQVLTDPDTYDQHSSAGGNITGNSTEIDHLLLNWNVNAQFIVTQRWTGVYNNRPIGVQYSNATNRWSIANVDGAAMPQNVSFNIHITHDGDSYNDGAVYNGGFEAPAPEGLTRAAKWNSNAAGAGSQRVCNRYALVSGATKLFANTGECAFLLKGAAGETRKLVTTGFYAPDPADNAVDLFLTLKKQGTGTLKIKAKVTLDDGNTVTLSLPNSDINGAYGWKPVSKSQLVLPGTLPVKVKITITLTGTGKVYIDDVSSASFTGAFR
jgi:hypothetical protein